MPFIAPFIPAIIGGVSSLASGLFGSKAASKSANQISTGQDKVAALTQDAVDSGQKQLSDASSNLSLTGDKISSLYDPFTSYTDTSLKGLSDLSSSTGDLAQKFSFDPKDLQNDPGYKFTLDQGQQAIQRAAAAKGGLYGTNTLKSLAGYTTGTADQYFNDAFQRANTTFNTNRTGALARADTLKSLASLGLSGVQGKAGTEGNIATQINQNSRDSADLGLRGAQVVGNAVAGSANAQAAGTVGSTNSWLDALKQGTKGIQDFLAGRSASSSGGSPEAPTFTGLPGGEDVTYQGT